MNKKLIIAASLAAFAYLIYKNVEWNSAMDSLGDRSENMLDEDKQYATQWSDRYDWQQGLSAQEIKNMVRA